MNTFILLHIVLFSVCLVKSFQMILQRNWDLVAAYVVGAFVSGLGLYILAISSTFWNA